jgi:hypothetical protein
LVHQPSYAWQASPEAATRAETILHGSLDVENPGSCVRALQLYHWARPTLQQGNVNFPASRIPGEIRRQLGCGQDHTFSVLDAESSQASIAPGGSDHDRDIVA